LVEYKNEAFTMFEKLINAVDDEIVHRIYKIQVQEPPEVHAKHQHLVAQPAGGSSSAEVSSTTQTASASSSIPSDKLSEAKSSPAGKKLGRNDPCWCGKLKPDGSPFKYKNCHYPN